MLSDADLSFRPDSRILEGFGMDDFDIISIRQFRQIFASVRPSHNWLALDDRDLLIQLGGYRVDRKTRKEGPTVAGILMFGKASSITDEECCPKFFPDYRELLSENPDERWSDRIYPDGTWVSNLFQFYRLVLPKLSSRLPKPFQISKGQRQDETPAHIALREAFVNALIHTDYSAPGNIVIESKPDVFRFTNPGTLLVTISQYYHGGISECRNTSLQKMFLMIGSAEKAGSGVGKILSGWDYAHWRTPYITIETNPDRLVLELPMFSILPEETLTDLRELFGESVDVLGKDELTILAACHIEGDITNSRLQFMLDRHKTDITKILQELCKSGYLISENKSRWTTYHLNADFNKNTSNAVSSLDSPVEGVKNLTPNLDNLTPNVDTLTPNLDTLPPNSSTTISSNEPFITKKRRLSKNEIESLIIQVCKDIFLTKEQIAKKIDRKPDYLQNQILPDMIKTGKLVYQFPDNINHPNQAYKS